MMQRFSESSVSRAAACTLIAVFFLSAETALASSENSPDATSAKARLVDLWQPGDTGKRMNIRGRVTSIDGTPLAGIQIDIRQPDGDGMWTEQYRTTLTTDARGRYQFGSVVPASTYCGDPHVEVTVYQNGWKYYDEQLVFQDVSVSDSLYYGDGTPVFLEESEVQGETIKYGRFDIVLSPE